MANSHSGVHLAGAPAAAGSKTGAPGKYDIFISYRRADRELVASVVRRLETRGVSVWYDAEIEGGADWSDTTVDALNKSGLLAIFFSEDSNNSRQLKKELAAADAQGKPVAPILIEKTQPRGVYLYELADRTWIQMFPEPMDRVEELVEHLAVLAGKSDGAPAGGRPGPAMIREAANDAEPEEGEKGLDEAVDEFIAGAEQPTRSAPKVVRAYVGRVTNPGPVRKMNDVPPFRWIDLAFLAPIWLAAFWYIVSISAGVEPKPGVDRAIASGALLGVMGVALYAAVVFPVRYYLRGRSVTDAMIKYVVSALMLFLAGGAVMLAGLRDGFMEGADFGQLLRVFGLVWMLFAVIAFAVYGVLSGQRAIRSFRSNLRKL